MEVAAQKDNWTKKPMNPLKPRLTMCDVTPERQLRSRWNSSGRKEEKVLSLKKVMRQRFQVRRVAMNDNNQRRSSSPQSTAVLWKVSPQKPSAGWHNGGSVKSPGASKRAIDFNRFQVKST